MLVIRTFIDFHILELYFIRIVWSVGGKVDSMYMRRLLVFVLTAI